MSDGRRLSLSVGLLSAAVIGYEIGLTRLFSFLQHYHYTFLVVSGAVCGLGLGAALSAAIDWACGTVTLPDEMTIEQFCIISCAGRRKGVLFTDVATVATRTSRRTSPAPRSGRTLRRRGFASI